ncbi:hypothetical protein K490DRAFT_57025 [Saccharata proteae CBS 121410]|uniref:Extracellular membrane protein CFEM domain-containing protein n=1 Tax=Saccharata proteae CBS 121410 TaxID=1314787 RepID=A0A9P4LVE6_9PEZI|nr:hypothetical protein K490DRAFT_57025 [Saccharata proteae CBS 121410]
MHLRRPRRTATSTSSAAPLGLQTLLLLVSPLAGNGGFFVAAQSGPQASLIPKCILDNCEAGAIASANCTQPDQLCHCVHQTPIITSMVPCSIAQCADPAGALYTFETLFADVCGRFNISVPIDTSGVPSNATPTTTTSTPTPSPSIYAGNAAPEKEFAAAWLAAAVLAAAVAALL